MPIYKYKFCDGVESDIEVSDTEYALLKEMDERECCPHGQYAGCADDDDGDLL